MSPLEAIKAGYDRRGIHCMCVWSSVHHTVCPEHGRHGEKIETLEELLEERDRLKAAIVTHRSQKADDRCIEDDDRLYEAVGDGVKCDRRVGDQTDMIVNCARFIQKRTCPGGWQSYVQLEATLKASMDVLERKERDIQFLAKRVAELERTLNSMDRCHLDL